MHDDAPCQRARSTTDWLSRQRAQLLDWSANSPHLKPIEQVCLILKKQLRNKPKAKTKAELWVKLQQIWAEIPQGDIEALCMSMRCRIGAAVKLEEEIHTTGNFEKFP